MWFPPKQVEPPIGTYIAVVAVCLVFTWAAMMIPEREQLFGVIFGQFLIMFYFIGESNKLRVEIGHYISKVSELESQVEVAKEKEKKSEDDKNFRNTFGG